MLGASAYADDLGRLNSLLERRENAMRNHYFQYNVDHKLQLAVPGEKEVYTRKGSITIEIQHGKQLTHMRIYPANSKILTDRQGVQLMMGGQNWRGGPFAEVSCYFGSDWLACLEFAPETSPTDVVGYLNLFPTPANAIYYTPILFYGSPHTLRFADCALLCNANLLKVQNAQWNKVEHRDGKWLLEGKALYRLGEAYVSMELDSEGVPISIKVVAFRAGSQANAPPTPKEVIEWRAEATKVVEGVRVPSRIAYSVRSPSVKEDRYEAVFVLQRVERMQQEPELKLPVGLNVSDMRLESYEDLIQQGRPSETAVPYKWLGRLLSREELRQLAYQQGHLAPPESPRPRFSLWLIAPALLLLIVAGYLYWRQRKG